MPRLELKSSRTFLAIKCCQGTKSKKFLSNHEACQKSWCIDAPLVVKLLSGPCCPMSSWLHKSSHKYLAYTQRSGKATNFMRHEQFSSSHSIHRCCNFRQNILPTWQRIVLRTRKSETCHAGPPRESSSQGSSGNAIGSIWIKRTWSCEHSTSDI